MNLETLSDNQLIALFKNSKLDKELKSQIITEIDRRNLKLTSSAEKELNVSEKIKIIFSSFLLYKYHVKRSTQLHINGNKKAYKQYWNYFNLGVLFYIILFLLITKYFIKPFF